jgi:hypothetical protein
MHQVRLPDILTRHSCSLGPIPTCQGVLPVLTLALLLVVLLLLTVIDAFRIHSLIFL